MDERMSNMTTDLDCRSQHLIGTDIDLSPYQACILLDAGLIIGSFGGYDIQPGHTQAHVERCLKGKNSWDLGIGATGYMEPVISLCTDSKQIGLFNGNCGDCVRDFVPYTDEAEALKEAYAWFKARSMQVPQVVRPMLTKLTMTTSRPRKTKK